MSATFNRVRAAATCVSLCLLAAACGLTTSESSTTEASAPPSTFAPRTDDAPGVTGGIGATATTTTAEASTTTGAAGSTTTAGAVSVGPVTARADTRWGLAAARPVLGDLAGAIDVTLQGATPNDGENDHAAFDAALSTAAAAGGGTVLVPEGTFLLTDQLRIPSNVSLRGVSRDRSVIEIDLGGQSLDGIEIEGAPGSTWVAVSSSSEVDSTEVELSDVTGIAIGTVIEIERDNDDAAMNTRPEWDVEWGDYSVGELAQVVAVEGNRLTLDRGLAAAYGPATFSRARIIDAVRNAGVSSLTVERLDPQVAATIAMRWATDVWVHDVTLLQAGRSHVGAEMVLRCSVTDSTAAGAHDHGDGGLAYGVSIARHSTGCLVENNTLYDLRHALIIQLGANSNVVAYNHARGSAGYADRQPRADISIHGHWPLQNLFEGNVVDRVVFADWWGPSGPNNVLHRNCVLVSVDVIDGSDDQRIESNLITDGRLAIDADITGTFVSGTRAIDDPAVIVTSPASYYLADTPEFLDRALWPPVQPDADGAPCSLPAAAGSPWADPAVPSDPQP